MLVFGRKFILESTIEEITADYCRAGISIGLIDDIPTCDVLIGRIVKEAEAEIDKMRGMISVSGADEAWEESQRTREAKL
jgi:hypothetical protein